MYYVWLNLKNFMKRERIIFLLTIICVVTSVIVILFSFGLYHHMEQKKMDARFGQQEVSMEFYDETYQVTTKGAVIEACKELPQDILSQCYFYANIRFPGEEHLDNVYVDMLATMSVYYSIHNGKVTVADIGEDWKEQGALTKGEWFSAEQVENGELVCIVMDPSSTYVYEGEEDKAYGEQFALDDDGMCTVGGKRYTPIGYMRGGPMPTVPVTTLDDDIFVSGLMVIFDHTVSRSVHEQIRNEFEQKFGDHVRVSDIAMPDVDGEKFYSTLTIVCIVMALISGLVLAVLYEYILLQRRRKLIIFRLCGLSLGKARRMYLLECLLICLVSLLVAVLLFEVGILPKAQKIYGYMGQSYTWKTCSILGLLYIGTTMAVLSGMIRIKLHKNIFDTYCE